jgi:16S rRNA (uracil1498-N3)-methyltransferase
MRRFTIAPDRRDGAQVRFDRDESHHLARVLRLKPGDTVLAADGSGRDYTVRLDTVSAESTGTIVEVALRDTESPFPITLVQGIPKGDKLEAIIRAATELGVARVTPALTGRTIVRLDAARAAARVERWRRVAREATKQCGRSRVPVIDAPQALASIVTAPAPAHVARLCLWEGARTALVDTLRALPTPPAGACVIVGPEGGLTSGEAAGAERAGWLVVGFGPRLLRTETAGPAIVSVLQSRYGDLA